MTTTVPRPGDAHAELVDNVLTLQDQIADRHGPDAGRVLIDVFLAFCDGRATVEQFEMVTRSLTASAA